jgi:hypothetical protein
VNDPDIENNVADGIALSLKECTCLINTIDVIRLKVNTWKFILKNV